MRFCSLCSGSSGNVSYLETARLKVLIDAGLSGKQIEILLREIGVEPKELDYILVTHEHSDHSKGVGVLSRRYNLPIVANAGTWLGMHKTIGRIQEKNIVVVRSDQAFSLEDLDVQGLKTYHDSKESMGFVFMEGSRKVSVLTDTGQVDPAIKKAIAGSDVYLFESNHDPYMLRTGPYPVSLQNRVAGQTGHLSNEDAARALGDVLEGKGEKILLAHLSMENNTPNLALDTVDGFLLGLGLDTGRDVAIDIAPRYSPSVCYELK